MVEWEQSDALRQWLGTFDVGTIEFIQNPNSLLDGKVFSKIYNILSNDQISIENLKAVNNENDWVNILLNLRQVSTHIADVLKEKKCDINVEMSSLARKKDPGELLKFMKCFLIYAISSPNRKIALDGARTLPKATQEIISNIIKECMHMKSTSPTKHSSTQMVDLTKRLTELEKEAANLKIQLENVEKEVQQQASNSDKLSSNVSTQLDSQLEEVRKQNQAEETKRAELEAKIHEIESNQQIKVQEIAKKKLQEAKLRRTIDSSIHFMTDSSTDSASLKRTKISAIKLLKSEKNIELSADSSTTEILSAFDISDLRSKVDNLLKNTAQKENILKRHSSELSAMEEQKSLQEKTARVKLIGRISCLSKEMAASPVGEAKRKRIDILREMKKLLTEVESLESCCQGQELKQLRTMAVQIDRQQKEELQKLIRKLNYVKEMRDQGSLKLCRLKLNADIQIRNNRLKKWKNCLTQ